MQLADGRGGYAVACHRIAGSTLGKRTLRVGSGSTDLALCLSRSTYCNRKLLTISLHSAHTHMQANATQRNCLQISEFRVVERFKLRLRDSLETIIKQRGGVHHAIIREAFLRWDANASGKLDPKELVSVAEIDTSSAYALTIETSTGPLAALGGRELQFLACCSCIFHRICVAVFIRPLMNGANCPGFTGHLYHTLPLSDWLGPSSGRSLFVGFIGLIS